MNRRTPHRVAEVVGLTVLAVAAAVALLAPLLAPYDPLTQNIQSSLLPPLSSGHVLGTDHLGRDVLSRVMFGGRTALVVSLGSVVIATVLGSLIGLLAAVVAEDERRSVRWIDTVLLILLDGVLTFPTILLAMVVSTVMGPGQMPLILTLGIVFSPVIARVVRSTGRTVIHQPYFRESWLLGTPPLARVVLHLVPNVLPQAMVQAASLAAVAIGVEAALSFLGLGTQPPEPSWGLMLKDARRYLPVAPSLSVFPGAAAAFLALGFQLVADQMARRIVEGERGSPGW